MMKDEENIEYIVDSINSDDEDLKGYVSELLDLNWIESNSAAEGVAKMFVAEGPLEMSQSQIMVLAKHGISPHFSECKICGESEWNEISFIMDNDACSWCDKKLND